MTKKKEESGLSPNDILKSELDGHKSDHYNYVVKRHIPRISSGSLILDQYLSGGFEPTIIRPTGNTESGKTASTLEHLRNFLVDTSEPRRGVYVKAEGRLSESKKKYSGVKFVEDIDEWEDGTCMIIKSNTFEFVANTIRKLMDQKDNDPYTRYWFIVDSMNGLGLKDDLSKGMDEAVKIAGGALLTSVFLQKVSLDFHELGHYASLIGQMRSSGPQNPYGEKSQKVGSASGGNAIQHYADWIFEYYPPNKFIFEDLSEGTKGSGSSKKIIGHYARLSIAKGDTEEKNQWVEYPIKYGNNVGSVFREFEIVDLGVALSVFKKKGIWIYPNEYIKDKITKADIKIPEGWQGGKQAVKYFIENPEACDIVTNFLKILIMNVNEDA